MPYGNKMPKKMGCSGGGPNMYKVGSKENDSPMNFSDKAMMYMKKMPAMYGKPKMDGDPVKEKRKTRKGLTEKTTNPNIDKTGYKGQATNSVAARGEKTAGKKYKQQWLSATKDVKRGERNMKFVQDNPGQRELNPKGVKSGLAKAKADQKKYRNLMISAHKGAKQAPKMYKNKK
jgi:hypothetical protein